MGYLIATAPCVGCSTPFSFNPERVPSIEVEGVKRPICRNCIERVNPQRIANGLPPCIPLRGAYAEMEAF